MENVYQSYNVIYSNDQEITHKFLSCECAPVTTKDTNFKDVLSYDMKMQNNRIILVTPSTSIGYQAASILANKQLQYFEETDNDDTDEYDDNTDEYDDDEDLWDFDENYVDDDEETTSFIPDNKNDYFIFEMPASDASPTMPGGIIPIVAQNNQMSSIDHNNVLYHCPAQAQHSLEQEENLQPLLDKNLILLIPTDDADTNFINHMVFQYNFDVIQVEKPTLKQEISILKKLLKQRNLKVSRNTDLASIIESLKDYRGYHYEEADIERMVRTLPSDHTLKTADFEFYYYKKKVTAEEQLNLMIGQEHIKDTFKRILAAHTIRRQIKSQYGDTPNISNHLAFCGEPGTGKTEMARILAQYLSEHGQYNGKFKEAGREDLIGKFVGHTSPKIEKLFKENKGGVIFIDEIDSLLGSNGQADSFASEAASALVRHMENNPDTMVIFATYPKEMDQFLKMNPGLSSRISKKLEFKSYSDEELWQIFKAIAKRYHYIVNPDCKPLVLSFIAHARRTEKQNFGNARLMRKLFQDANECSAYRVYSKQILEKINRITAADLKEAISHQQQPEESHQVIGFALPQVCE